MGNCYCNSKKKEMETINYNYKVAIDSYHKMVFADHSIENRHIPPSNGDPEDEKTSEIRKQRLFSLDDFVVKYEKWLKC